MEPPDHFDFPFAPYNIQDDFMRTLYRVIDEKKLGIFESPTGTGKSLSIICGAVRWLKDYKNHEKHLLDSKIAELTLEKSKLSANVKGDWLSSQSQEIQINYKINELKLELGKIELYDRKIDTIKDKHLKYKSRTKKWENKNKDSKQDLEPEVVEDDDILLEEPQNNSSDSDSEENCDKYSPVKILICSRTHSQLSQIAGEILKSPFAKDIRVVSLASRQNYCLNPEVLKLKNSSLINEKCLDMQKNSKKQDKTDSDGKVTKRTRGKNCKCQFYKQGPIEDIRNSILSEVQDIEDLIKASKEKKGCPYYASRLAAEDAEIVLLPYNTILHKPTREANGIDLKNNVVIIDEAHNLLESMAQMYSSDVTYNQIQQSLDQLKCYKNRFNTQFSAPNLLSINQLIFILDKLHRFLDSFTDESKKSDRTFTVDNFVLTAQIDNYNMFKIVKFCNDSRIAQKVRGYCTKYPIDKEKAKSSSSKAKKGIKDFLTTIKNSEKTAITVSDDQKDQLLTSEVILSNPLLGVISFLETLTYSYTDGRVFIKRHEDGDKFKAKLQFLLLNPSQNFADIVKESRSVIVAGGTMKPTSEFKHRLFINSGAPDSRIVEFTCDHIIPPSNILPIILTEGQGGGKLLFNFDQRMSMGAHIKSVVERTCRLIKGGVVVFFPSYKYESWAWQQIKDLSIGRTVFREPQDSNAVESVLKKYAETIRKPCSPGALLLSVVGGKLSEGLNFSDDLGRCVIVVGLPYANIMAPDLKEKMAYLDKTESNGAGRKFYEGLCMKAVNQSIGRAVRHKNDYATILLLDERYNRDSIKKSLPDWIKRSLKVCKFEDAFKSIQQFFDDKTVKS